MPRIKIDDTTIAYETWGDGPPIVLTPHGWFQRGAPHYLMAGRLSKTNQVLLWDRPNSGASDVVIVDTPSEFHLWADLMHELLHQLDMAPAYFGGASNGSVFSLFMAYRYREDVKGLILLDPPTDDIELTHPLSDARYLEFAKIAETQGMQAVIEHSHKAWMRSISIGQQERWDGIRKWVAETIVLNPSNQERLLAIDPEHFGAVMERWGEWFQTHHGHVAGLSAGELKQITILALVMHGFDDLHPQHSAQELANLLPNAEFVDYTSRYSQEEIRAVQESEAYATQNAFLKLPFIEDFLQRHK